MRATAFFAAAVGGAPFRATADENISNGSAVRARLGYLPTDNLLTYVTGGFAYGRVEYTGRIVNNFATTGFGIGAGGISVSCDAGTTCFAGSSSSMATGWTAGAGFEYAIWKNVTFKAEYLYVSLGSDSVTETALAVDPFSPADARSSFNANFSRTNFNVARVSLNLSLLIGNQQPRAQWPGDAGRAHLPDVTDRPGAGIGVRISSGSQRTMTLRDDATFRSRALRVVSRRHAQTKTAPA